MEQRIDQLHADGIVDLHFDMPMDLYEKRESHERPGGGFFAETSKRATSAFLAWRFMSKIAICRRWVCAWRSIRFLDFTPKRKGPGVSRFAKVTKTFSMRVKPEKSRCLLPWKALNHSAPTGNCYGVFYELGVRVIGLTHARRNAAGEGGVFAPSGSSRDGLTEFGRDVVRQCEALGVIVDLAHISPAGFEDILAITTKPPIVSHTNARKYYDIERNISDEQIKMIGERRGVIGVNAVLVSPKKEESTLDRYIDHIEHIKNLIGIDGVAVGFDFFEFIYRQWPESARKELAAKFTTPHFIPDLSNHSHARNLTRRLIERGFSDMEIEKILRGNWMRIFREIL